MLVEQVKQSHFGDRNRFQRNRIRVPHGTLTLTRVGLLSHAAAW
jgi:hypothetical protein